MKTDSVLIYFLGSVALCTQIAHALICFQCENETSNWNCLHMTTCAKEEQRCVTIGKVSENSNETQVLITKKCAERCPSEREYPKRALSSLFCCERSWCNLWPPK